MINKKTQLLVCTIMTSFLFINPANALNNYTNLHNDHEIIAKYEHGGKGYEAVTKDNYNGYSYGKWQISTKRTQQRLSTFDTFLSYLSKHNQSYYKALTEAGGYKAAFSGDTVFILKWKKLCREQKFKELYDDFILNTQILPAYKTMEKDNDPKIHKIIQWSLNNNTIQAALHSIIIQHGPTGGYRLIKYTCANNTFNTQEEFLKCLYNARKNKYPKYIKRYNSEYKELSLNLKP